MGARSEDIGAVLKIVPLITLSDGSAWNGVADVNGTGLDREAAAQGNMPLSGKLIFEINGTAADTARIALEDSADDSTYANVTDRDGNNIVIDLVAGTTDRATVDVKLTGENQYIRGTLVAANSTIATTADLVAYIVLGGGKVTP